MNEIWQTARRNKLRTTLTGFAVAWGIFMLVVLLGAGNGLINAQLKQLNEEEHMTQIIVTHDPNVGAQTKRIIRIKDGIIEQ